MSIVKNPVIKLVTGSDRPGIVLQMRSYTGAPIDLSAVVTSRLRFREVGASVLTATLTGTLLTGYRPKLNAILNEDPPYDVAGRGGRVQFMWPSSLHDAGEFEGEVSFIYSDGGVLGVFDILRFTVRAGF